MGKRRADYLECNCNTYTCPREKGRGVNTGRSGRSQGAFQKVAIRFCGSVSCPPTTALSYRVTELLNSFINKVLYWGITLQVMGLQREK